MSQAVRRKGAVAVLLLTVFIDMMGFGIIIPFIPFWAQRFDATPDLVTALFATYSAVAFVSTFVWGWLSDRWGRKPALILALFGSTVSFAWLGLAEALWMLFAARALGGVFGASIPVAQAFIADVTPPEGRARGMGMMGAALGQG
jgi:MFS family permease